MSPAIFWRFLKQNALWFLLLPCLTAGTVYYVTRHEIKTYKTQATLYTGITSGYSLRTAQDGSHVDYTAVSNAFDNILTTLTSKETLLQVGEALLSQHLALNRPDRHVLGEDGFQRLQRAIPAGLRQSLVAPGNPALTQVRIDSLVRSASDNPVKLLLLNSDTPYSVDQISKKLHASRRNSSDMLDLDYEADDPALTQQTLSLAISVLNERYTSLKNTETNPVVGYYEDKVRKAKQRLDAAEGQIQAFNVQYNVLNFGEELKNRALTRGSIISEYNAELMQNKAVKASLDALNQRMAQRGALLGINTELTDKQAELTEAESKLINGRANNQPRAEVDRLQARVNALAEDLKEIARHYFAADNSSDAVPQARLISDWLTKVLAFEESGAKLGMLKKRLDEYQTESAAFSPLESQLRQLNRNLSVTEKEYLDLAQALNQANTHRQDISIEGALTVLDPPSFPFSSQASKRLLLILVGAGVGLFLALFITALRFWLDQRLHSPERAEAKIGRPLTALFPTTKRIVINSKAGRAALSMFEQLGNAINIELAQVSTTPPLITLFSIRSKQGKTWVAHGLARLYVDADLRVAYLYPRVTSTDRRFEQEGLVFLPYELHSDFMQAASLEDLLNSDSEVAPMRFDRILLELPALIGSPIPVHLVRRSAVSVLIADVNGRWGRTEKQLFSMYQKVATHPILTVVNRVENDFVEVPSMGDVQSGQERTKRTPHPTPIDTGSRF